MKRVSLITCFVLICFFFNSCEKEVSVNPEEKEPSKGFIYIESLPTQAKIYLNGKNTGRVTPDSIRWLPEGNTQLLLRLENYRDSVFYCYVSESERIFIKVNFLSNPNMRGHINCRTSPSGASIFINDSLLENTTPFEVKSLLPGKYKVKFQKYSCWSDSIIVTVRSGETANAVRSLQDSTVWVTYNRTNCGFPSNYLTSAVLINSTLWIASSDNGIISFSGGKFFAYNTSNSPIPDNIVYRLASDTQNNLWIATYTEGLVKYDGSGWTLYNKNSGLPDNELRALAIDKKGRVWIGTYNKGAAVLENNIWKIYSTANSGISSNMIKSIAADENNNIWIGTYNGGVNKFDGSKWVVYNMDLTGLTSNNVEAIYTEGNKVWLAMGVFGTNPGGLAYFDGSSWSSNAGMPSKSVMNINSTPGNDLWIGTQQDGLARMSKAAELKEIYKTSNSLIPVNNITSVVLGSSGIKWITTAGGGLVKYKGN